MIQTIKLNNFRKAIENLKFVLKEHKTPIIRDAAIKRYELCYELAWKAVQEALKNQGLEIGLSPKNCFKQAFKQGWIEQEQAYAEMVKNRNLTTHTYNEALADEIYQQLAHYLLLFEALSSELEKV
jgi:nucleotidyltransferase substrate binding protein (TIGR01987 family)